MFRGLGPLSIFVMISFIITGFSFNIATVNAQTDVGTLQKQIEDKNQQIQTLNAEIQKYQELASKANAQSSSLKQLIAGLEADRSKLNLEIKKINIQIDSTNLNLKDLSSKINVSEDKIKTLQEGLEKSLREISQNDNFHVVLNLLNNKSFSDFFGKIDDQEQFNASIHDKVVLLAGEKATLEQNKTKVEKTKKELSELKGELDGKKKVVEITKTEQQKVLTDTKSQEASYQKLLATRKAQKDALEKEIFEYESKIKFILDPNSIPVSGSSPLAWPLDDVYITQNFGRTVAAKRLYVSGTHNGTDFKAPLGTPIRAMAAGVVDGTGDTDKQCNRVSFGRWILLKYSNGLASTYGHLSVISVSPGQSVTAGQIIGYSGNTGYSTGPHLHLSVYVASAVSVVSRPSASCPGRSLAMPVAAVDAYLDPMLYLPPYKK